MTENRNKTDSVDFIELIDRLKSMYESWQLQYIFLNQKLGHCNTPVKINELAELIKEVVWGVIAGKVRFNPDDSLFSYIDFHTVARHVINSLRRELVKLFRKGENKSVYMLLVSDDNVYWGESPEEIEKLLKNKKK